MKGRATTLPTDVFHFTFPDKWPNDTVVEIDNPLRGARILAVCQKRLVPNTFTIIARPKNESSLSFHRFTDCSLPSLAFQLSGSTEIKPSEK